MGVRGLRTHAVLKSNDSWIRYVDYSYGVAEEELF